ncbi:hypothetical protein SHO565_56000 [Streptomyces sp. HO565]
MQHDGVRSGGGDDRTFQRQQHFALPDHDALAVAEPTPGHHGLGARGDAGLCRRTGLGSLTDPRPAGKLLRQIGSVTLILF